MKYRLKDNVNFKLINEKSIMKYKRLQGKKWNLVKDNFKLLYTHKSDKDNIKGIYTNGIEKISHWMNDYEKTEYLRNKEENKDE